MTLLCSPPAECAVTAFLSGFRDVKVDLFLAGRGNDTNCSNGAVERSSQSAEKPSNSVRMPCSPGPRPYPSDRSRLLCRSGSD